jgi:hypothetical protein
MTPTSHTAAPLLHLGDYRRRSKTTYFNRAELDQLLGVYSRQVARGEWRDYAIDHRDGIAVFSVFRHTHETPLYAVVKYAGGRHGGDEYAVFSGRQKLHASRSLGDALHYFRKKLALVSSR